MSNLKKKILITLIAVLIVAALIFLFSAQSGEESSELSGRVTGLILSLFVPGYADLAPKAQAVYLQAWGGIVRKMAHFSEFALLAFLLSWHLRYRLNEARVGLILILSFVIAALYAGTDELHQVFVSSRAGRLTDVLIDCAGAATGTLLGWLRIALRNRRRARRATG